MWPGLVRVILVPAKLLFGYDAFVSYARSDGKDYAERLLDRLSLKIAPRSDLQDTDPSYRLPLRLRINVVLSRVLVIVGTPGALASKHVAVEIRLYRRFGGGPFVPIRIQQLDGGDAWLPDCQGVPWQDDDAAGGPADRVLDRIVGNVGFWKRSRRQAVAAVVFAVALLATGLEYHQQSSIAESRHLAQLAIDVISDRPDVHNPRLAAEYALKAIETSPTSEAQRSALAALRALLSRRVRASVVSIDPRGRVAATSDYLGDSIAMDLASGRQFKLCGYPDRIELLEVSPTGRYIAAWRQSGRQDQNVLEVWDVAQGTRKASVETAYTNNPSLTFLADESRIFVYGYRSSLFAVPSGELIEALDRAAADAMNATVPPKVAELFGLRQRRRKERDAEVSISPATLPAVAPQGCRASPDHQRGRAVCAHEGIRPFIFDMRTGQATPLSGEIGDKFSFVEFSPDDELFALERYTVGPSKSTILGAGSYTAFLSMWRSNTGERLWEVSFTGTISDMDFVKPRGDQFWISRAPQVGDAYTGAFVVSILDTKSGRIDADLSQDAPWRGTQFDGHPDAYPAVLWIDPDGKRAIVRTYDALRLWDVNRQTVLRELAINPRETESFASDQQLLDRGATAGELAAALKRRLRACS
jgi:WD40 repeat protein